MFSKKIKFAVLAFATLVIANGCSKCSNTANNPEPTAQEATPPADAQPATEAPADASAPAAAPADATPPADAPAAPAAEESK